MAVADGAILRIVASLIFPESVIAQNVFYAVFADTGTSADEQDVVDDLGDYIDDIYNDISALVCDDVSLSDIKVYVYDSTDDDWDEIGTAVLTTTMNLADDMLPHGVAYLVHAKSIDPDVTASKYFGGIGETRADDGEWNASTVTPMANALATWITSFVGSATGADFAPVVWSTVQSQARLFSGTVIANLTPAYQRRRKPGVGI